MVAGCHFLFSLLIVPLTLRVGDALLPGGSNSFLLELLYALTRMLYFPLVSLGLYPRHWFPGPWISVPTLANSILWGVAVIGALAGWRRWIRPQP